MNHSEVEHQTDAAQVLDNSLEAENDRLGHESAKCQSEQLEIEVGHLQQESRTQRHQSEASEATNSLKQTAVSTNLEEVYEMPLQLKQKTSDVLIDEQQSMRASRLRHQRSLDRARSEVEQKLRKYQDQLLIPEGDVLKMSDELGDGAYGSKCLLIVY